MAAEVVRMNQTILQLPQGIYEARETKYLAKFPEHFAGSSTRRRWLREIIGWK